MNIFSNFFSEWIKQLRATLTKDEFVYLFNQDSKPFQSDSENAEVIMKIKENKKLVHILGIGLYESLQKSNLPDLDIRNIQTIEELLTFSQQNLKIF